MVCFAWIQHNTKRAFSFIYFCNTCIVILHASADMVDDGACGEIFPIDDEAALTALLLRLLGDSSRIRRGGERSVRYGRETFDFTKIIQRLYYLLWEGDGRG